MFVIKLKTFVNTTVLHYHLNNFIHQLSKDNCTWL